MFTWITGGSEMNEKIKTIYIGILLLLMLAVSIGIIIGMVLISTGVVEASEPVSLHISGYNLKLKTDNNTNIILSYFKNNSKDIMVYDLKRNTNERVPGSENRDNRYWLYQGLGLGYGRIGISWCVGNHSIYYAEKEIGASNWIEYYGIHSGTGTADTNRTDIAISSNETIIVIQSDSVITSLKKPHGDNWHFQGTVFPSIHSSEPTHPAIFYHYPTEKYYTAFTCSCGVGTGTRLRSVQISRLDNDWVKLAGYDIVGAPDALGFYVDKFGNSYFATSDWCSDDDGFCVLTVGKSTPDGQTTKWNVMEETFGSYNPLHPTHYHQPNTLIAVDELGNMIVAYCHFWQVDDWTLAESYIHKYQNGSWSKPIKKGESADIAVTYFQKEKLFYLCYVLSDTIHYETISMQGEVTPTPTTSPTSTFAIPTNTPTILNTPTSTFTPGIDTPTPIPTAISTPTATPECPQYECRGNFQEWQCCRRTDFVMLFCFACIGLGYSRLRRKL